MFFKLHLVLLTLGTKVDQCSKQLFGSQTKKLEITVFLGVQVVSK